MPGVNELDPLDHLIDQHKDSLETKAFIAAMEQAFQRRTHQIHNKKVVLILSAAVINSWNALSTIVWSIMQHLVELTLCDKLRMFCFQGLHLHRVLISAIDPRALVDLAKGALINQLA